MTRMTVTLDPGLLREAQEALQATSKAETLRRALAEIVRRKHLQEALDHQGKIDLDIDQEGLAKLRSQD